jgi:hypothetical protein
MHFVVEAGAIVPAISDPFGWGWNLFGTANLNPGSLAPITVVWYAQVSLIIIGHIWSLYLAHRIAEQKFGAQQSALRSQIPMLLAMIVYSTISLWITAQPMEMRTAM